MKHYNEDQIADYINKNIVAQDLKIKSMILSNQTDKKGEAMVYPELFIKKGVLFFLYKLVIFEVVTTKTPLYTMIDKKTEITAPEINLFPIHGKNIELSFNGDRISSDGGLLLLRELDVNVEEIKYFKLHEKSIKPIIIFFRHRKFNKKRTVPVPIFAKPEFSIKHLCFSVETKKS
jgi:hypothetical protein